MIKNLSLKTSGLFILVIALVVGFSLIFSNLWSTKSKQQLPEGRKLVIEENMTIEQFGQANRLPNPVLKEMFNLKSKADLEKTLKEYGSTADVAAMVGKKLALASEHAAKNWFKIALKFALWLVFLSAVFIYQRRHTITQNVRRWLLFAAFVIFGVLMGSDPGPMGTVKDAIHLYADKHVIFPPRLIALTVFLILVFIANKYICAWGCQLGTLQDFMFRINQNNKFKTVMGRQIKLPFAVTNTIRAAFLFIFTAVAFAWGTDIIEPIDPFKIFNPLHLGLAGAIFAGLLLIASLFIYRPWCHLFCPFGLAGWLLEKISLFKIKVNYNTCIACGKCEQSCPSTVMGAILKQDKKTIPDCFACNACIETCPTKSISFSTGRRLMPPQGHFDKKNRT